MNKLTIQLKQHTPIIHFQHEQAGATLRATEVKPKLDRFILEKLGAGDYEKGRLDAKEKGWLIDKEKGALDYKMRISPIGRMINEKMQPNQNDKGLWSTLSYPTFFANMGKENKSELVNFIKYDNVNLSLIFKDYELQKQVTQQLNNFFLNSNFGTRQSKGFGSFYISDCDSNYKEIAQIQYLSIDRQRQVKDVFEVINYYHQRLKSGVNFCNKKTKDAHYKKAFLFKYIQTKEAAYNWDKKWLKEEFFPLENDKTEKRFARAFLGLSYDYKFGTRQNPCYKDGVLPSRRIDVSINTDNNDIQRIKSPILYKPIQYKNEWRIYIVINKKIYEQPILNKRFDFSDGNKTKSLSTPEVPIDLNDLLGSYHKELGESFKAYQFNGNFVPVKIS